MQNFTILQMTEEVEKMHYQSLKKEEGNSCKLYMNWQQIKQIKLRLRLKNQIIIVTIIYFTA